VFEPLLSQDQLLTEIKKKMHELRISQVALAEHLGVNQPEISKILLGKRTLRYNEAEQITSFIIGKESPIPPESLAYEKATSGNELEWAYSDERLKGVARRMYCRGFSQLPIMDRETNEFHGVITERFILNWMMRSDRTLEELREIKIKEIGKLETILHFSQNTPTREVTQLLLSYPAILLEEKRKITGIITRSDLLKFLFTK